MMPKTMTDYLASLDVDTLIDLVESPQTTYIEKGMIAQELELRMFQSLAEIALLEEELH